MKKNGFTAIETMCAVGVVGAISVMAVMTYQWYLPQAQAKEAGQMMQVQVLELSKAMQNGYCTPDNKPRVITGHYGALTVGGTYAPSKGASCLSGCTMQYNFNSTGVDRALKGKNLTVDVMNNLKFAKNGKTTLQEKYIASGLIGQAGVAGDDCAPLSATDPTKTDGSVDGSETGLTQPTSPDGGSGGTDPGGPTDPGGSTDPGGPTDPNESGNSGAADFDIHVNSAYGGTNATNSGYFIKNTINVYDAIVSHLKAAPTNKTVVKFIVYPNVAVVGDSTLTPAFNFDARLPAGMTVLIENNGYILGRGGDGARTAPAGYNYGDPDLIDLPSTVIRVSRLESYGWIQNGMVAEYRKQYPVPMERLHYDDDDWVRQVGRFYNLNFDLKKSEGGNAIHQNANISVKITNKGVIGGGGGGGFAVLDVDRGNDSGVDHYEGAGAAPFGRTGGTWYYAASLFVPYSTQADGYIPGKGGKIGQDGEQIDISSYTNAGKYHKAGCAFTGSSVNIKNMGASAQVLGNSNCPQALSF